MRVVLLFLVLLSGGTAWNASAQSNPVLFTACTSTCSGDLGENIFPNGDFGSGVANVLPNNPGLAPGYTYQVNPPPNDGFYCIANNTAPWGSFAADTWIDIMDNGPEPNGYMMVVNASYQPGLFYQNTVSVCENTLYEFSIDVISLNVPSSTFTIQPNVSFLIDSVTVCETGPISINGQWYAYRFSFVTAPGQTSVKLAFRNNAPGGYGNDLAIDNLSFRACGPEIDLPTTEIFCSGELLTLSADLKNSPYTSTAYQWQVFSGTNWVDVPGASNASFQLNNPTNGDQYRLVVANSPGNLDLLSCRAVSQPVAIMLDDLTTFAIGGQDTIVCNGAPAVLEAGNYANYEWSTGAATASIEVAHPGLYTVTVTTVNGCTTTDELDVVEVHLSAAADWNDPVCFGDSTGSVQAKSVLGGVGPIRFFLDDGLPQSLPNFINIPAGLHLLQVSDSLNCQVNIAVTINDPPRFEVYLGEDQNLYVCDSLLLSNTSTSQPVSYTWQPAYGLNCTDCPAPVAMPVVTTTYSLFAEDAIGCLSADSITIHVLPRLDVYGPNVFIQDLNSNGQNSYFTVYLSKSATRVNRLSIYDRWGELVFNRKDLLPGDSDLRWDGIDFHGKTMDEGVYVWVAEIEFTDGVSRIYEGDVTLLKQKN